MRKLMILCLLCSPVTWVQAAPKTPTDKIVDSFMALDRDMSNGVSESEYMNMVKQRAHTRFLNMDRNHDGEVSDTEYRRFWNKESSAYYRLQR